jgi:hypothetical protein
MLTRYDLHLLGSDGTGEAEFRLFGKVAENVVGIPPRQTILKNYHSDIPITNLAIAAAGIRTPPEVTAVVSWKYRFLLYVTTNSFTGNFPSFDVHSVEAAYPLNLGPGEVSMFGPLA